MLQEELIKCILFYLQHYSESKDINEITKYLRYNKINEFTDNEIIEILNKMYSENLINITYNILDKNSEKISEIEEKDGNISKKTINNTNNIKNKEILKITLYSISNFGYEEIEFLDEIFVNRWIIPDS